MRFCVSYSESHKIFLENFFLKTFPFEEGVTLIIERLAQKCATGGLFSHGWRDQMIEKEIFINKYLNLFEEGEVMVFSDVDIRFYGNIRNDLDKSLGENDICFMKDHNSDTTGRCGGFFVLKVSDKMKDFFGEVLSKLKSYRETSVSFGTSEQSAINDLLAKRKDISWGYLSEKYYTHGLYVKGIRNFSNENQSGLWWENKSHEEKSAVHVPDGVLVHHAYWCNGIDNKVHLLNWVNDKIEFRKTRAQKESLKKLKSEHRTKKKRR